MYHIYRILYELFPPQNLISTAVFKLIIFCHTYFAIPITPGVCECDDGWTGPQCVDNPDTRPALLHFQNYVCDTRLQTCDHAMFLGDHFQDDGSLVCRISEVQVRPALIVWEILTIIQG